MDKLLTVVIPSYNVEKYLKDGLKTLLHEDLLDQIEILIVNDGSTDSTAVIGMEFQEKYPGTVCLINKENGGHGSTINTGIEHASGYYFKVVDGDDWVDTDEFVKYVKDLGQIEADVVLSPFVKVNSVTGEKEKKGFTAVEFQHTYHADQVFGDLGSLYQMHSATFRTAILKQMPKISEHCFYVDHEYILYPLQYIDTVVFLDCAVYQYRVGNNGQSVSKKSMQKNRGMHLHVVKNLIKLYCSGVLEGAKKELLERRIEGLCRRQIEIYLSLGNRVSARELDEFTEYLKGAVPGVYCRIPGKKEWLLRVSDNRLFGPVSALAQWRDRNEW